MPPPLRRTIDRIDDGAGPEEIDQLLAWVQTSEGIERARQEARRFCQRACDALAVFAPSEVRRALEDAAWSVLARRK
jgi:geranylgeranyl pyrophosphate synthase